MTALLSVLALMGPLDTAPALHAAPRPPHISPTKRGRVRIDVRIRRVRPYRAKLIRMARCESGLKWHLYTGNGFSGGLQFLPSTWRSVGGTGMPHHHEPLEQMYRAVLLIRREGYAPWPVCGYR